jgi:hypothetical protein
MSFVDLKIQDFGSTGIYLQQPIVSRFDRVVTITNGLHGFYITGAVSGASGTSCSFINCYANTNAQVGWYIYNMTYCALHGCAADNNGLGYWINNSEGITLNGCGAEGTVIKNGQPGTSFEVFQSNGVVLNGCWVYNNVEVAFWVTGSSAQIVLLGCVENFASGSPTASFKIDSGCVVTLDQPNYVTATSIAAGTTTIVNDGIIGYLTAPGGLRVHEAANSKQGITSAMTGGTITVSNTSVTANSRIFLTAQNTGGTPGALRVSARTPGTSFTITSSSGSDTSTVAYQIFEPG